MSALRDKANSKRKLLGQPLLTGTVEKGFWGRSLNNIDSRSNGAAQSRFKNPFVRIRLFQILIPQLHFGDFFNSIAPKRTLVTAFCCDARCYNESVILSL